MSEADEEREHFGYCEVCKRETGQAHRVRLQDLFEHLRVVHNMDVEPETWPDGEFVIVDESLEPIDFEEYDSER